MEVRTEDEHDVLCNAAEELEQWLEKYGNIAFRQARTSVRLAVRRIDKVINQLDY